MAIIQGLQGGLSGKLGNTIFRQRKGETVAAQYQPVVANPRSDKQVSQREKFKLMSQLAALMAPGLYIRPKGSQTARNIFASMNFKNFSSDTNGNARINALALQLTDGSVEISNINISYVINNQGNFEFDFAYKGAIHTSSGNLAVATRPERRGRLMILAIPNDPEGIPSKLIFSGIVESIPATPPVDPSDVCAYEGTFTPHAFDGIGDDYTFVAYAYEIVTAETSSRTNYDNIAGDESFITLGSQSSISQNDIIVTASTAAIATLEE